MGYFHKCQKKEKPLTMHNMNDWECLYGFLNESANIYGAPTVPDTGKSNWTKQTSPYSHSSQVWLIQIVCQMKEEETRYYWEAQKGVGLGLRGKDGRSRRHCEIQGKLLLLGTHRNKDQPEGWGKKSKGIFTWSQAKLSSVLTLTQRCTVAQVRTWAAENCNCFCRWKNNE